MPALRVSDQVILSLVRWWSVLRHPRLCLRTTKRSRALPDPARPATDIDKFLWRKIFDHNPLFTMACDKIVSKAYARATVPGIKMAEILWVGHDPTLIPDRLLTGSVVVKANHGSRWNVMIHKGCVDRAALNRQASSWLARRYGRSFGEWGYRDATRCLFVEEMLLKDGGPIQSEFKFHVAGGRTAFVFVESASEQSGKQKLYLDRDGNAYPVSSDDAREPVDFALPACFVRMRHIAETLAAPFDFVRCDLYELNDEIYFSEFTVYPFAGVSISNPALKELRCSLWDLRRSWFLTKPQNGWRRLYAAALHRWLDGHQSTSQAGNR